MRVLVLVFLALIAIVAAEENHPSDRNVEEGSSSIGHLREARSIKLKLFKKKLYLKQHKFGHFRGKRSSQIVPFGGLAGNGVINPIGTGLVRPYLVYPQNIGVLGGFPIQNNGIYERLY